MSNILGVEMKDIVSQIVRDTLREVKQEERRHKKGFALYNTRLLLENYDDLVHYYDTTDCTNRTIDNIDDTSDEDVIYINSIKRSKTRTMIMIIHIQKALEKVKKDCELKKESIKYEVIEDFYLNKKSIGIISDERFISPSTVKRYRNELLNKLSILIFGVDGLRMSG